MNVLRMLRTPGRRAQYAASILAGAAVVAMAACASPTNPSNLTGTVAAQATGTPSGSANGAKPIYTTPATITFANRAGDAITGNGTYAAEFLNGSLSFACCTGQIVNYNMNSVISGTGATGTYSDPSDFHIASDITAMAVGSTMLSNGFFKMSLGQINFNPSLDPQSSQILVTRVDSKTWTVDTSAGDVGFIGQTTTMPDPNNPHKTITVITRTFYHLPFRLTGVSQ